jgi:hypothetical protein
MRRTSTQAHFADVAVLVPQTTIVPVGAPGGTYAQGEAGAAVTAINFLITQGAATETNVVSLDAKVNLIIKVLQDAELIPSA